MLESVILIQIVIIAILGMWFKHTRDDNMEMREYIRMLESKNILKKIPGQDLNLYVLIENHELEAFHSDEITQDTLDKVMKDNHLTDGEST